MYEIKFIPSGNENPGGGRYDFVELAGGYSPAELKGVCFFRNWKALSPDGQVCFLAECDSSQWSINGFPGGTRIWKIDDIQKTLEFSELIQGIPMSMRAISSSELHMSVKIWIAEDKKFNSHSLEITQWQKSC